MSVLSICTTTTGMSWTVCWKVPVADDTLYGRHEESCVGIDHYILLERLISSSWYAKPSLQNCLPLVNSQEDLPNSWSSRVFEFFSPSTWRQHIHKLTPKPMSFFNTHCKNTWVSYFNHIFFFSEWPRTPKLGFLESSSRSFFISYISSPLFSEDLFGYIHGITTKTMQPRRCRCARSKKETTNLTRSAYVFLKGDRSTNLTKEGSFSTALFQIVRIPCHAHKRNATEMTKIWLK